MHKSIGVIAEDESDIEVIRTILGKSLGNEKHSIRFKVGNGCGRVRSKCFAWSRLLKTMGCKYLILVHDLDRNELTNLDRNLNQLMAPFQIAKTIIVIPVTEIEAWLLADHSAIQKGLNLKKTPNRVPNPESIVDPKKKMDEIIQRCSGNTMFYLNTKHNLKIAEKCSIANMRRCKSFERLYQFIINNVANKKSK